MGQLRQRSYLICSPSRYAGRVMAIFYAAIPVGSALGYVIGGLVGISSRLALGILPRYAARIVAWFVVLLATRSTRRC